MKKFLLILLVIVFSLSATEKQYPDNPALLGEIERFGFEIAGMSSTEPTIEFVSGEVQLPIGLYQTTAFSLQAHRKLDGFSGVATSISYTINPWNRLVLGGSIGYMFYEDTKKHHRGLLDVGMVYRLAQHPVLGQHLVGVSLNNLLFAPSGLRERLAAPTNIHISWDGGWLEQYLKFNGLVGANLEDTSLLYLVGVSFEHPKVAGVKAEITDEFWKVGILKNFKESIGFSLSASYGEYRDGESFLMASCNKRIGPNRDALYSRKMARSRSPKPGDLWTNMLKRYYEQQFYASLQYGGRLIAEFPDFFQNSLAYYYLGNIFQKLDLRAASQKALLSSESKFEDSRVVPYCRLAQLKLEVKKQGEYAPALYEALQDSLVRDSIRDVSHYYLGECYLMQQQYDSAISCYKKVPTSVASYKNAQRESAVAQYLKDNSSEQIIIPESLVLKLDKGRSEYEKQGLEYYDLIKVHATSYTIERLKELEELMQPYRSKITEYHQLIENEKNRIYQLSQQ